MIRAVAITLIAVIAACGLVTAAAWKLKSTSPDHTEENQALHHTVQQGETLKNIAEHYYGSGDLWPAIANANGLKDTESLKPGTEIEIPGIPERRETLLRNVFLPVGVFTIFAIAAAGIVVKAAADSQQPPLTASAAVYAVLLTALTGASVIAAALAVLIIRPDLLELGIWLLPAYALPALVTLTTAQGVVLNLSTGITHGKAVVLTVILNIVLGITATAIAAFVILST
jgi:LysM repeat protein